MDAKDITRRIKIYIGKGDKMQPMIKRVIKLIWTCLNPKHEHLTETEARECIEDQLRREGEESQENVERRKEE